MKVSSNIATLTLLLTVWVLAAGSVVAQTPTPRPTPVNPATQPPGQDPLPTPAPNAPPGTQPISPQSPPGVLVQPTPVPTPFDPTLPDPREPNFPVQQAQPLLPMPDLSRVGIISSNILSLSLNDAIRKALQNNNEIEIARDDVRFAETQLRGLYGVYDPLFSITPQIIHNITPQQSSLGGGGAAGTTTTTIFNFSPQVTKYFERGGGNYTLSFANSRQTTNNSFSSLSPFYSSNLALQFNQPLFRNRSIDLNRRSIKIQKKFIQQTDSDFRQRTIQIISQVQAAYWNLVFALRNQQNQLESLNVARQNMRNIEAQIEAGAKAPLDRAQVQTDISLRESLLFTATQNVSISENSLKQLMLRDPAAPEWTAQITPTDTPVLDLSPVNLQLALDEAHKNRPEIRRLNLQKEINSIDIDFYKNQTKPQVDLNGTFALTGLAGSPCDPVTNTRCTPPPTNLVGGYGKDIRNLFSGDTRNLTVGVTISFPFKNRTAEANLAGARIQRDQLEASFRSQDQAIEMDVRNAAQAVDTARRRVLTSRMARESAEQQLAGEEKLYEVGRSTTFLLLSRQNELTFARTNELQAQTDYNKALADLQRATGSTLRINNITVEPTKE
ncbi:MAG TPA: TolC family protein [Pyrinomonadaceae bacterium]|nr:TolC family protein [Pyrinomonadaceae bacterium]